MSPKIAAPVVASVIRPLTNSHASPPTASAVTNEVPAAPATARNARRRESARNSWIRSS